MSTSKEAWELAWREECPNAARVAHYDGIAAAKRCGFEAGYLAAAKLSPGLAGSADTLNGDTAEMPPGDVPLGASLGTPGGLGENLKAERARLMREAKAERIDEANAADFVTPGVDYSKRKGFPTRERVARWNRELIELERLERGLRGLPNG
jgi:hypothetical protein